ncbi:MAG: hypothetical protein GYB66_10375 [Chloroflexi bacterium]|nr:hypothetical protein [Chloroflexota bacterium]
MRLRRQRQAKAEGLGRMGYHLFLSPHPDDVVLSCGGLIVQLVARGESIEVWTLMAADPPLPLPASPLIDRIHRRWDRGNQPFVARRREDRDALSGLGVGNIWFGDWVDCIYRVGADGTVLYPSDDAIFGDVHLDDPLQHTDVSEWIWPAGATIYMPLSAGNHVDHQIVRLLALRAAIGQPPAEMWFYEEYPYSAETDEVNFAHAGQKGRLSGAGAVQLAIQTLPAPVAARTIPLAAEHLNAKIEAIAKYRSQITTFWSGPSEMATSVRSYAQSVGNAIEVAYAERFWHFRE